jgi:hypothetical protein
MNSQSSSRLAVFSPTVCLLTVEVRMRAYSARFLTYFIPEVSDVQPSIFDIQGRLVTNLVDSWREAGEHEVSFDGSVLSSGVYIYRLTAGIFTAPGKMVLVK